MEMSFREKSAWAYLVSIGAVYVPYFTFIFKLALAGELSLLRMTGAFIVATLALIVLSAVYQIVIRIRTRAEAKDERDIAIESRAFRSAHWTLVVLLWLLVPGTTLLSPLFPQLITLVFVGQLGLLAFVVSELVHYATQILGYRRGY